MSRGGASVHNKNKELLELCMTVVETRERLDQLVRENLNLVYASALRQARDVHLAADVTQAVFMVLQKKLPEMDDKVVLGAWLLRVTRYACLDAAKRSRRRLYHEKKAAAMRAEEVPADEDLSPLIDQALDRLSKTDRELLVLAYYEGRTHEEIAARLGLGREATHKRVQRAVGKLRALLSRQGMLAAGIPGGLEMLGKPMAAPAAVSQAVLNGLGGQASALALQIAKGTMLMMKVMKMKTSVLMVAAAGLALAAIALMPALGQGGVPGGAPVATQAGGAATAPDTNQGVANPLYNVWKGQEGKTVTFNRSEQISGGAPVGGARPANISTVQFALAEFTAEQAVIKITTAPNVPAENLTIPAKFMANDPAFPKAAGTEDLKIGDKTYACTKYTYTTNSKAEMGRDGQGLRGRVTVWVAQGVPGGIVQRHISLTIRASYDITDTFAGMAEGNAASKPAAPAANANAELAVTEADAGKTLKLGDNTAVAISLAGNPTTGYSWSVTKMEGTALEQAGDIQYVRTPVRAGIVGSGGTFIAKFRAVKAGESTITLGYARSWENGVPPAKTFTVTLVVEKAP